MARITLLGTLRDELVQWLEGHPNNHERGAIILFRRLSRKVDHLAHSDRYIGIEIIPMKGDWVKDSSNTHFTINMRKFPEIYLRCEVENLELGFVHNHPNGFPEFSEMDDENEKNILRGLAGCNGSNSHLVSLLYSNGKWKGRVRIGRTPNEPIDVRHTAILSDQLEIHLANSSSTTQEALQRQSAAFGAPFNSKLKSLRIAVVGVGGTGSPVATLLARCGVGELILIDGDDLEKSNMNRVRGYRSSDLRNNKAESLARYVESLGLGTDVLPLPEYLGDGYDSIDALSSADVVFGCTDDAFGRDIVNQALYYYGLVLIDSGLAGNVINDEKGIPSLRSQKGRVSCILPESGNCLRCQGVITDQMIKDEQKFKDNPELKNLDPETLRREYYIQGGGIQNPGVGPFTSATADNAVATLMDLVGTFRKLPSDLRLDNIWIDFIHMNIQSNIPKAEDPNCIYCGSESVVLLKEEKECRLDSPAFGKL